jgi:signal transduction histidine kinase
LPIHTDCPQPIKLIIGELLMIQNPNTGNDGLAFPSQLINAMPGKHLVLLPDAPTFTIAAVSEDFLAALNLQRESLTGHGIFEVFFSDRRNDAGAAYFLQSLTRLIQTKQTQFMTDQRYDWPNALTGEQEKRIWRPVTKPVVNSAGEVIYIIHTVEDITHEKQLAEVTQANQYMQTIINLFKEPMQVLQPIFDKDEIVDFRFKLTNQAYASYANATPQEIQGKKVGEVFPGYFETASFTNSVETYRTGKPLTFEVHYDKDGLDLYNLMNTAKLEDEVIIHFTDFTRLRQLQLQLEKKIEELNRSNDNLLQVAYIAGHDLQEPLRKIQAFSDRLIKRPEGQLSETDRNYLQRISSAAARMSTLINDLLAYSRIVTYPQDFDTVSLTTVVNDVLMTLDWAISQSGAQIVVHDLPTVNGNASQLTQMFQNLLSNALKFTRSGTRPCVEVSSVVRKRSELLPDMEPISPASLFYEISVRDEGIGFDAKYAERIFQVFQRLHGKNEYAGTGIGLAICRQVVAGHGGWISAVGVPDQGATFRVFLPAE